MKNLKNLTGIIAIAAVIGLLLTACTGGPTAASGGAINGADELDTAIREASDYLNNRIPQGNKVAFINISGGYPDLADYILGDLSKHGVNDDIFSVVDRTLLDQVRAELNFNWSGEVSDQSAQEIGKMLGAQAIVSGSVRKIGALYRLEVKAIEVQTAAVQGQWNRNIPNGMTIAALTVNTSAGTVAASSGTAATASGGTTQTATSGAGTTSGTAQATTSSTATPAAPARPANGTYTFTPRLQAYREGIPIEVWIYQIVVRGNYLLIYLGNAARGPAPNSYVIGFDGNNILTNLDNPVRTWTASGSEERDSNLGNTIFSFQNVTGTRFSLDNPIEKDNKWRGGIFEEIDLSKAHYEP